MAFNELCKRWLGRSAAGGKSRPPTARRRSLPLRLEQLEDRTVPANFTAASVSDLIADINAANLTAEADTITLVARKTFTLTARDNFTDMDGANGLPMIVGGENLTIIGNGDTIERSSAAPAFRLLDVAVGASLTLENLTLQGGLAFGSGAAARGAGAYNQGTLTLDGVTVQNNTVQGSDGSVSQGPFGSYFFVPGGSAFGGGLYSNGTLQMEGCTIQKNAALGGQGADGRIYVYATDGGNAFGGGLYVGGGRATITGSSITHNTAMGGAAGKFGAYGSNAKPGQGIGGGIYIDSLATVILDTYTVGHTTHNKASTSVSDIYGSYTEIP